MKKGIIVMAICVLCFALIVSISFGMWTISAPSGTSSNAATQAEKALNTTDFIYYDTTKADGEGIECFSYYKTGFLDSTGALTTTGELSVYYIIDFDKVKQDLNDYDNLTFYFTLKNGTSSDQTKFNSYLSNVSTSVYKDSETTPLTLTNNTTSITYTSAQLNSMSGTQTLQIKYVFTCPSTGSSFESNIYNNLKDITFKVETKVEGTNN